MNARMLMRPDSSRLECDDASDALWTCVRGSGLVPAPSAQSRVRSMTEIDVKLLRVFLEIYNSHNISQAAIALGLTQPTMSFYLAKLRTHYDDPLFVRGARGMIPTPFATDLHPHAQRAVVSLQAVANFHVGFDPATAARDFVMSTTDISQTVLLPRLMNRLRTLAPNVGLRVHHIEDDTRARLVAGEVDIAVGFMPQLDAGFFQQKMFRQHYVCIAPEGDEETWGFEAFQAASHIRVMSNGSGHSVVEKLLREQGVDRRVVLEVPNYLGLLQIVRRTGLVAIVPNGLTWAIEPSSGIAVRQLPLPIALPQYDVKQHWHERNHRDPAHQWLRGVLTELFQDQGEEPGVPPPPVENPKERGDIDARTLS